MPVPVPYEQYIKDHPESRNQPPVDFSQIMQRFVQHYGQQQPHHQQNAQHRIALGSEPSVKIINPGAQTASAVGGGSITYLRPIGEETKPRRPRDEKDVEVAGKNDTN